MKRWLGTTTRGAFTVAAGLVAAVCLPLAVLALAGWHPLASAEEQPGALWFVVALIGMGAGTVFLNGLDEFGDRRAARRPPRVLREPERPRCPECGKSLHTANGVEQHRRAVHGA